MSQRDTTELLPPPDNPGAELLRGPAVDAPAGPVEGALRENLLLAGRFRLVRHIATGGMGEVFEAFDQVLRIRIALKSFRQLTAGAVEPTRLEREVRLARRISHPNVLRVFEFFAGEGPSPAFLTMELLDGETLSARLRRVGRLTPTEALPVVRQIVAGLGAAHSQGVVHRDLKASNVFLARPVNEATVPRVVVADFGIARALVPDPGEGVDTATGLQIGSPYYMAPEQVTSGPIDERTDVYALGVVLYEMVTGELPFTGETPLAAAVKRLDQPAPSARSRIRALPRSWDRTIRACLERDPRRRPRDVKAVLDGLENGRPVRWSRLAALVAGLLVVTAAALPWLRHQRAPGLEPTRVARRSVAILPLLMRPEAPENAWAAEAVKDMLAAEVAASGKLRSVPRETLNLLHGPTEPDKTQALGPEELGRMRAVLGADVLVSGALTGRAGDRNSELRLDIRALETSSGETLAVLSESSMSGRLVDLGTRVGSRLRTVLGGGDLLPSEVVALQATRPRSEEGLRDFSEGLLRRRLLQWEQARQALERAVREDGTFVPSRLALAETLFDLGRPDQARETAREALALAEQIPGDTKVRAEALLRRVEGNLEAAASLFGSLFEQNPDAIEDGLRYAEAAPVPSALAALQRLRQLPPPLGQDLRIDLQEAAEYLTQSAPDKALAILAGTERRARQLGARLILAQTRNRQAEALLVAHGQAAEVEQALDEAEAIDRDAGAENDLAALLQLRGYVQARQGWVSHAHQHFEEAVEIWVRLGNHAQASAVLGDLAGSQARTGGVKTALRTVRRFEHELALAGSKGFPLQLAEVGYAEFMGGRFEQARRWLAASREGSRSNGAQPVPQLYLYTGALEREAGNVDEARQALEAISSNTFLALDGASYLALLDCEAGRYVEGAARIRHAHAAHPDATVASHAMADAAEASCALGGGDETTAERLARGAFQHSMSASLPNPRSLSLLVLATLESKRGQPGPWLAELSTWADVAASDEIKRSEFEARLALAAFGRSRDPARARREASALAAEAGSMGFVRLERAARAQLADLPPP
jgi:eukaryotic-like serine/threonine-protein kinase